MSEIVKIDYFSDLLCVWAWIAERRLSEVQKEWGEQVQIHHHFMDIFADSHTKLTTQWADRGSFSGFAAHVIESAAPYEHAMVNRKIWDEVRPTTSASAHLALKAVQLEAGDAAAQNLAHAMREAFFVSARDISRTGVLQAICAEQQMDWQPLQARIDDGTALAALLNDHKTSRELGLKGSPSWVMNNNRQTLYGNVGYRIISANIEEILRSPEAEASWC